MKLPDGVSSLVYRDDDGREIVRKIQPEWIPVSERLPEDSGEYLVSVIDCWGEDDGYEAVRVSWFAHPRNYDIKAGEWRELGIDETVIAWMPLPQMPLPQPYKGESEE